MDERRKLHRRHLFFYLRVIDQDSDEQIGFIVDITTEGVMLISETPIEEGKNFNLKMMLPQDIAGKQAITFKAESLWCKPDINDDFYDTGFAFTEIAPEDADMIGHLINFFGFTD